MFKIANNKFTVEKEILAFYFVIFELKTGFTIEKGIPIKVLLSKYLLGTVL